MQDDMSQWQLLLAACMLRCQREAAADVAAGALARSRSRPRSAGDASPRVVDGAHAAQQRRARVRRAQSFVVPAHATIEHIHWLEMARSRHMKGRPVLPADVDQSEDSGNSGSSAAGEKIVAAFVPSREPSADRSMAGIPTVGSGTLRTWATSAGDMAVRTRAEKLSPRGRPPASVASWASGGATGRDAAAADRAAAACLGLSQTRAVDACGEGASGSRAGVEDTTQTVPACNAGASQDGASAVPTGLEDEVVEVLLLLQGLEGVCEGSGYERAAWVRHILKLEAVAATGPGWRCEPLQPACKCKCK